MKNGRLNRKRKQEEKNTLLVKFKPFKRFIFVYYLSEFKEEEEKKWNK